MGPLLRVPSDTLEDSRTRMKKIVITGGAGFIGSHLGHALVAAGYAVHAVDNLSGGKREDVPHGASFHEVDVLDTAALLEVVRDAHGVFHLAALPRVPFSFDHPRASHEANIDGTFSVLLAARDGRARRVIYAASSSSYGEQPVLPFTEDMRPNPLSLYALQKLVGEEYARLFATNYGLDVLSLRFFNVYGPRMRPDGGYALAVPRFLELTKQGEACPVTGDGEQTRDFTHVRDVVRACIAALESDTTWRGDVINIAAGRPVSVNRLVELIGGRREFIPKRHADLTDTFGDVTKAAALLGWRPEISLEEGIAELRAEYGLA